MRAGVVGYKLCDRDQSCEECSFDRAMRGEDRRRPQGKQGETASPAGAEGVQVLPDPAAGPRSVHGYQVVGTLFYDPRHVWVRVEEEGKVRIGLDDFGQKLLGRVYAVSLPKPGTSVSLKSQPWRVAHGAGDTPLAIPVAGVVSEINERLVHEPSLLNRDPYGQGSAMSIVPHRLAGSLRRLFYGKVVEEWCRHDAEKLRGELMASAGASAGKSRKVVGATLPDGGAHVEDLLSVVGKENLVRIINLFLRGPSERPQGAARDQRPPGME